MHASQKIIAVVGLSNRPDRPSYEVAAYLQAHGSRILGINPQYAGQTILGEQCYATLTQAAASLASEKRLVDIVDCFRKAEDIPPIVDEAITIGAQCIWMQQGIVNESAAATARQAGLVVVMDLCTKVEHREGRLHGVL